MRAKSVVTQRIKEIEEELGSPSLMSAMYSRRKTLLEDELRTLNRELADLEDREREAVAALQIQTIRDGQRAEREEAAFWFRRFFTTLGIANGAAFAALASGLLQADQPAKIAHMVAPAMDRFIWGALGAGSIPFWLWLHLTLSSLRDPEMLTIWEHRVYQGVQLLIRALTVFGSALSVVAFCWGLFLATGAVHGMAEGKKVADARAVAESKARAHAPPPARE